MSRYDISFRPEDRIPNIVYKPDPTVPLSAEEKEKLGGDEYSLLKAPDKPLLLCRSCHWNTKHEYLSGYISRLRVWQTASNKGLWTMGNDWLIWDRTTERAGNDYMTYQFLKKQNVKNIPLLKEMAEYKDENCLHNFVVMSRARGIPLQNVWAKSTQEQKKSYALQVADALRELRQFTAEFPQRVDGSPVWDSIIGNCNSRKECVKIGKTKEAWLKSIDEELREGLSRTLKTRNASIINAKKQFPDGTPYVLTHADLNLGNILVHDGKNVAIIDWELAGYQPWWVEVSTSYARSLDTAGDELFDMVWKELGIDVKEIKYSVRPIL